MNALITVETDAFEHRHVKPHFINPCCFGEDFASWLKKELTGTAHFDFQLSDPIQEDYGWGLWASHSKDRYWIALSYFGDGPQEPPAKWIISVTYDRGLNLVDRLFHRNRAGVEQQLRNIVRETVISNHAIRIVSDSSYEP